MTPESENNRRIAKNIVILYLRMIVVTIIGLYSSRIVLKVLGVADFGIFNVIGGVIGVLGYVNTLLAGGISRFLTVSLGEENGEKIKEFFATSLAVTIVSASIVFILGETVGLWFVNYCMNIESERLSAANWVYQSALVSSCVTIIQSPFTALVISHEKMNIYAFFSSFDVIVKLLIVLLLPYIGTDKLTVYAVMLVLVSLLDYLLYRYCCRRKYKECLTKPSLNMGLFKEMFKYNSWNMVGGLAGILSSKGIELIVNIFFGSLVNAAMGIANQVSSLVVKLFSNIHTAANPQIIKYYSQGRYLELFSLTINTSKYSAYVLLCGIVPLYVNMDGLLSIWLTEVPAYAAFFSRCILVYSFVLALDAPLGMVIHAVGKMKIPNLSTALINLCVFPLTIVSFKLGGHPAWGYYLHIVSVAVCMVVDIFIVKKFAFFPSNRIVKGIILPVVSIAVVSFIVAYSVWSFIGNETVFQTLMCTLMCIMTTIMIIFFFGIPLEMRKMLIKRIPFQFH